MVSDCGGTPTRFGRTHPDWTPPRRYPCEVCGNLKCEPFDRCGKCGTKCYFTQKEYDFWKLGQKVGVFDLICNNCGLRQGWPDYGVLPVNWVALGKDVDKLCGPMSLDAIKNARFSSLHFCSASCMENYITVSKMKYFRDRDNFIFDFPACEEEPAKSPLGKLIRRRAKFRFYHPPITTTLDISNAILNQLMPMIRRQYQKSFDEAMKQR